MILPGDVYNEYWKALRKYNSDQLMHLGLSLGSINNKAYQKILAMKLLKIWLKTSFDSIFRFNLEDKNAKVFVRLITNQKTFGRVLRHC